MANDYQFIANDVELGKGVILSKFVNLYGCRIGDNTKIGAFVEIQKGVTVGKNCKISSHAFICEGVTVGDNCFIGHSVVFINDNNPQATNANNELETDEEWMKRFVKTGVGKKVSIGSNATIMGDVTINDGACIPGAKYPTMGSDGNSCFKFFIIRSIVSLVPP